MSGLTGAVDIVDLGRGDVEEAIALLRSVAATGTLGRDPDEYDVDDVATALAKSAVERLAIGARSEGVLVGIIMGSRMTPRRFRHVITSLSIAVEPSCHGRGIGRALFEAFLGRTDRLSPAISRVELILQAGNPAAQGLYASLGFEEEGVLRARVVDPGGTRIDDIMMARLR